MPARRVLNASLEGHTEKLKQPHDERLLAWFVWIVARYLAIIQLIASTTTSDLTFTCRLDASAYEKDIKVSDDEMASLNVKPACFHGKWNYTIAPRRPDG